MAGAIEELRARIAELDRTLVETAGRRLELVEELSREKTARGLEFVDPEQERRLTEALVASNEGALGEQGVRELVEAILALTKRELARRRGS
jgi:chorismate mutase